MSRALPYLALLPLLAITALVGWASRRPAPPPPARKAKTERGATAELALPKTTGSGWRLASPAQRYDAKTLFDRINGAAPTYLEAGFRFSFGAEYRKGAELSATADLFALGTPAQAKALYLAERYAGFKVVKLGEDGYAAGGGLSFLSGRYYVKLAAHQQGPEAETALEGLGADLAATLSAARARKGRK
ncbi:MAG: hypothetical protein IT371_06435 [Deltaproteobacteria bacterium]|nr:hypothetical protein [Deltaproteobacteria bacterium]